MEKAEVRRFMICASITTFCKFAVWLLSPVIYFFTLYLAYLTSFPSLLAALFFPFIAQHEGRNSRELSHANCFALAAIGSGSPVVGQCNSRTARYERVATPPYLPRHRCA